jgi:hypothetical protein
MVNQKFSGSSVVQSLVMNVPILKSRPRAQEFEMVIAVR